MLGKKSIQNKFRSEIDLLIDVIV